MVIIQKYSKRKPTGARYKATRTKRLSQKGSAPARTTVGAIRKTTVKMRGSGIKQRLLSAEVINVLDQKTGKYAKAKIQTVAENPANRHFVRRNIMTKGAVVMTDLGKVKVTSKPGQAGAVNGIKVE
jgi:small subunit ribosomal protein S8e